MKKQTKTVAIIQARMGSKRLPGKCLMEIGTRTILERVVNRLKAVNEICPLIDEIVVATTVNKEDDQIEVFCHAKGIKVFRGESQDVLKRYYDCALKYKADWILRVTADCPLIDPFMIYGLLGRRSITGYSALAFNEKRIPAGWDVELFSFDKLEAANEKAITKEEREHVTLIMRNVGQDLLDMGTDFDFTGIKYDVDTEEDFDRVCKIARYL
jgi:spore coat polysaccharide biosynthesis protein SpsF